MNASALSNGLPSVERGWISTGSSRGGRKHVGAGIMLCVRIDGREVETTPVSLARLVFDGRADRHSPAKVSGAAAERSLEQALESPHCEALSDELLRRLQSMYVSDSPEIDLRGLCERVERLSRWRWTNPHIASRFLWAAAWLNDVMDRLEQAAEFYDLFLQTSSRESHLRLLAYNNRGVLRIRLGRLEGVHDLARAAIPQSENQVDAESVGLPAACFNLLNLINVSLGSAVLTKAVDAELAAYFAQLPEDCQLFWLGNEGLEPDEGAGTRAELAEGDKSRFAILCDPSFKRLNILTTRLSFHARDLAGGEGSLAMNRLSAVASQLVLWDARPNGDGSSGGHTAQTRNAVGGRYGFCAEAASLLLSEDIPASLTRLESPLARAEQSAREELADIEGRLALGQYELAKSRLQVQRKILASLNRRGRLAGLLARVDAQLEHVAYLESQSEQLALQRTCASLIAETEQFCRITDLCRAQRDRDDLVARLQRVRSGLDPQTGAEVAALLDELSARLERHLVRIKRVEIRRSIRGPMRTLRRNWPTDWALPVPEAAEKALAQCHVSDPQCCVEDWVAMKDRLDAHQGRHHLHKAMALLQAEPVCWDRVEGELAEALACRPDLWSAVAPLFGVLCPADGEATAGVQAAMRSAAARLFDAASEPAGDDGPLGRAGGLLNRAFQQTKNRADRCLVLWRRVADTLSPLLEQEDLDAISQVKAVVQRCLDGWPMEIAELPGRVDPRHPANLFLESCDKARRLTEARRLLNARPARWDEATAAYGGLLDLGLDTPGQLRRAATGYYLAVCRGQDAPHVQRQILAGLEAWLAKKPPEAVPHVRRQDLTYEIERLRTDAGDCPNDTKGGGPGPQEQGKSEA